MRKLSLILVAAMLLISCKKEVNTVIKVTWYQDWESVAPFNVNVMEYNSSNEVIKNNPISSISNGDYVFIAQEQTEKVKIYCDYTYQGEKEAFWINQVFYLTKGDTTEILINGDVITSKVEP